VIEELVTLVVGWLFGVFSVNFLFARLWLYRHLRWGGKLDWFLLVGWVLSTVAFLWLCYVLAVGEW